MKIIIVFIGLLFHNYSYGQSELEQVKSFVNDVLLDENYSLNSYLKHIHYYNQHSKEDKPEFEKYLEEIKFLTLNTVTNQVNNKDHIRVIDLTNDKGLIKNYIQDDNILPSYQTYGVFENEKFITAVIIDDKKNIISFLTTLSKTNRKPPQPLFLNESF